MGANNVRRDWHVQRDSFTSYCGRRIGTPGGKIYPGVRVQLRAWYVGHRYPDAIRPHTCLRCLKLARLEIGPGVGTA